MGYFSMVLSIFIFFAVVLFELIRPKKMVIDFLTAVNIVYLLAFAVAPLYIYWFYDYTTWESIRKNDLNSSAFLYGSLLSIIFYIWFVLGYYFFNKLNINSKLSSFSEKMFNDTSSSRFSKAGLVLLLIGGISLIVYIAVLGGFKNFIELGPVLRSNGNYIQSPLMFLKNLAPLLTVASFIYYALFIDRTPKRKRYFVLFLISFIGSSLILFHSSGRMSIFVFLITFPLAHIIMKNKISIKSIVLGTLLFLSLVLFGDSMMNVHSSSKLNSEYLANTLANIGTTTGSVIEEFSFPFTNIANATLIFPTYYDYRYGFLDFIRGLDNVIPRSLINLSILAEERPSQFNTRIFNNSGTMPVDIVTFGYMSFGFAGVMIIGLLFGLLTKMFESLFSFRANLISCIFFSAWMIFFSFRIVYGDPGLAYSAVFDLAVGTILLYFFAKKKSIKERSLFIREAC
ncbi:O-antigen polymerase [Alkalihalophilus marmarensis]|uniref:O-antigen polymerase n=1 Tax=Alkalihalophilus marmarensis TaxID=521377 RepID=UPI002DB9D806|nr:O-antigen polymerase [Alkalihalophilus marmarensis]MEC2073408.1 O-antigen ligase [Alkalihalophilus marmarensis]